MNPKYNDTDFLEERVLDKNAYLTEQDQQDFKNWFSKGRFYQVIKDLAQEKDFKYLMVFDAPGGTLRNQELVLRFAAFYFNGYRNYYGPTEKFLNDTMEQYRNLAPKDEVNLRADFRNTIHIIRSLFGKNAFKRFYAGNAKNKNGQWETHRLNVALFDILMYSFARQNRIKVLQHKDSIDEALIDLMTTDQEFIDSIEVTTSNKIVVTTRFDKWIRALENILDKGAHVPGRFNYELKFELFTTNSTCSICQKPILMFDDSTYDSLREYWIGDRTIPAHARLAHRYCKHAGAGKREA
jgi:hypothetical protein